MLCFLIQGDTGPQGQCEFDLSTIQDLKAELKTVKDTLAMFGEVSL